MKHPPLRRALGGLLLLFSLTGWADVIRLEYQADNLPPTYRTPPALHLTITPDTTEISDGPRRLVIDYAGRRVVTQSEPEEPPREFPLYPPLAPGETPQGLEGGLALEIARYELQDDGPGDQVHGWRTQEKTLYFGAGLAAAQVAGPFAIKRYGRTFRERRVHVRVSNEHPHALALRQIAEAHRALVAANPLLLQLDWVNMIPVLDGLPVALLERGHNVTLRLVLKPSAEDFYHPAPPDETPAPGLNPGADRTGNKAN